MLMPPMIIMEARIMEESLAKRVRAAAIAGWWTLLIAVGFGVLTGVGSMAVLRCKPDWVLRFWAPDLTWAAMQTYTLWILTAYKLFTWIVLMVTAWLSLWARQLRRLGL